MQIENKEKNVEKKNKSGDKTVDKIIRFSVEKYLKNGVS